MYILSILLLATATALVHAQESCPSVPDCSRDCPKDTECRFSGTLSNNCPQSVCLKTLTSKVSKSIRRTGACVQCFVGPICPVCDDDEICVYDYRDCTKCPTGRCTKHHGIGDKHKRYSLY
ncbi:overproduction-induced pheromone-resistant [Basidiobolus ranarum]|uniref:Overproduction-induced pheromone-resistant n=1 Tax=Basidiobolus ranarum TaxID=34480 RepID=A0ABR2WLU6_9FUNG